MKKRDFNLIVLIVVVAISLIASSAVIIFPPNLQDGGKHTLGIRIAQLIIAFFAFMSSAFFSYLVYKHDKTISKVNDDANSRAEEFRKMQFSSNNYSIIEFRDRMLIYKESEWYINDFLNKKSKKFHMIEESLDIEDILKNPKEYQFVTMRIPYGVIEGKLPSNITFDRIYFSRRGKKYYFVDSRKNEGTAYILYNQYTQRHNVIVNLIVRKDSDFFDHNKINVFSKIKMQINITSLLGVVVKGTSELFFTNPKQIEGDGSNTYPITSSNFVLTDFPTITDGKEHPLS